MMPDFELISHTADLQIRVYGTTHAELFTHALIGMFQSIGPRTLTCTVQNERLICPSLDRCHTIDIQSSDLEQLLVDFLSQALSLSDIYNELYLNVSYDTMTETSLKGTLEGVAVTGFDVEIKAVTYHGLAITQQDGIWQTDIVFDI